MYRRCGPSDPLALSKVDPSAPARYRRLWSRWRKIGAFIEEKAEMYPLGNVRGDIRCFQQLSQVAIERRLRLQLTELEAEFGMAPLARTHAWISLTFAGLIALAGGHSYIQPVAEIGEGGFHLVF